MELSAPQNIFLNCLNTKNTAYVGGFGSGKTFIACLKILIYAGRFPGQKWGFWAPTYPLIRDVFYPTFDEAADLMGFSIKINKSDKEVGIYRGSIYYGTVICRSMSDPSSIVGYKVAGGICDEIDTMKKEKAEDAWRRINARLRSTVKGLDTNWLGVTTTPEGFNFVYDHFKKEPKSRYSMVQASTYENQEYLPPDYIENLYETYPDNLISAYINGDFVNLTSGTVYIKFDRKLNCSSREWDKREAIHIGCDFNVGRMCSVAHVIDGETPIAVDEITGGYDTPDMIRMIKQRYWNETSSGVFQRTCQIYVYPDSSGKSRKSVGASETDISLMVAAGFSMMYNSTNPAIKDRVNAMNAMFCNAKGDRRYFVNTNKCPNYTQKLEQQAYKNGEPEKDGTEDVNDAGGYFIAFKYPVIKPVIHMPVRFAI